MKSVKLSSFDLFSKSIGIILIPLVVFISLHIPNLKFNYDIDSFYNPTDPELMAYRQFKEHFENENDYILIGIRNEKGIFRQDFLLKIDSLTHILEKKEYLSKVISPTSLSEAIVSFGMPVTIPLVHINDRNRFASDKEKIYSGSIYKDLIFSSDEQSVSIITRIEKSKFPGNEIVINDLNKEISRFGFTESHLAGRTVTQFYYKAAMQKEMKMFLIISIILVFLSVLFIFRSVFISFSILFALIASLTVVYGLMGMVQFQITLIQTMLPLILLITGVSPCIHLVAYYRKQNFTDRSVALKNAFWFTFTPNSVNTITTALGFATLYFLPMPPIKEFAVVTSLGVLVTYVISTGVLTGILSYATSRMDTSSDKPGSFIYNIYLYWSERKIFVYSISVFLILLSVYSLSRTEVNNNFLDDVPEDSELNEGLSFFETRFSGIRPLEVLLIPKVPGDTVLTRNKLNEIKEVQGFLETEFKAGFTLSPIDIVEHTNQSINGGSREYKVIPDDSTETNKLVKKITRKKLWNKFIPVYDSYSGLVRITGRTLDMGSRFYLSKADLLEKYTSEKIKHYSVQVTGASSLMDNANKNITSNLITGILLMSAVIFVLISVYMRSLKLAVVGITVNIIPVLTVFTFLSLFNIPLKVSSALMFTVVFGIAIDDTIHFLSTYKKFRQQYSTEISVEKTIRSSGLSMVFTTIILTAGFSVFSFSSFTSISAFGIIVALSLFIALCADLLLLPLMFRK